MSCAWWTTLDDDRSAFAEAMDVADVALRRVQAEHDRLRRAIAALEVADQVERDACLAQVDHIETLLETPPVTRWRQQHNEGRGRKHSQQYVLERKLDTARRLLAGCGIDLDGLHVSHRQARGATPDPFR